MRLVIWHRDPFPTTPGIYLGCFPGMGHEITWVTSDEGPGNRVIERHERGVHFVEIQRRRDVSWPRPLAILANRWNKLVGFVLKLRVMSRLARGRPDILQVRDQVTVGQMALHFARRNRIPFTFQFDYPLFESNLHELDLAAKRSPLRRAALKWWISQRRRVLRGASLVLPISDALGDIVQARHGVPAERIVPLPVGVSRDTFERATLGPVALIPGIDPGDPTVCYMGSMSAKRNPAFLFHIMEEVHRSLPEAKLLVIGKTTAEVGQLIESYPYRDRVVCTGFLPHEDVPAALRVAKVGVFPLPMDDPYGIYVTSSPLKVVEYMSCGLPVVASRVRDAEQILSASGGGVCLDNRPELFAEAILDYLHHPEMAQRAGEKGRCYIGRYRLFDIMALETEAAYERLLATDDVGRKLGGPSVP